MKKYVALMLLLTWFSCLHVNFYEIKDINDESFIINDQAWINFDVLPQFDDGDPKFIILTYLISILTVIVVSSLNLTYLVDYRKTAFFTPIFYQSAYVVRSPLK